ncbi:MAG: hypothetical protein CM1200mP39_17050 [Dehalococcoidia bacterium]|nr:MAG: hypothetical protein CM1200mP39_17050 [Dehalococcoidia bacterium]
MGHWPTAQDDALVKKTVALGIFVFELTGSPFWVGVVGFLRLVPMFIFGPFCWFDCGSNESQDFDGFSNGNTPLVFTPLWAF